MVLFTGQTLLSLLQLWNGWRQTPVPNSNIATLQLDGATLTGVRNGSLEYFLGVPYAQPPVGDLRLRLPQVIESYKGTLDATAYGHPCLSQPLDITATFPPEVMEGLKPLFEVMGLSANVTESEDCLHLNIVRPANVSTEAKLPVIFFFFRHRIIYNGTRFVEKSIELGEPVIYVALNYRLYVMGFLGGREIKEAGLGNLGLQDQRAALRWVNKFISAFGGDPSKVTIWGESAGAMSVFFHLYANGGDPEGLFRAGIMSSGFAIPTKNITSTQGVYEFVVGKVGCANADDTLKCLRTVSADSLIAAANEHPEGMPAYFPREDGSFISMPPMHLPSMGRIANVPVITGDVKDEGTLLAFSALNITTDDEVLSYLSQSRFPGSSPTDFNTLLEIYPSDPAAGSPFDTGNNARGNFPGSGHFHGSDLLNSFGGGDMTDYFVRFANHLDPNAEKGVQWPPYNSSAPLTLQFNEGSVPLNVTVDDQRAEGMNELTSLVLRFPF
ncbi:carotenoid ester lipase precursor [Lentinus tigrinus ALCF2SS1-7]|uniref:carotenoid ester lipase precursor n=1 Tax=Lentinus tigrinus ALCF2SS1-7 TaxID=1328758 RepID=UPI001165EAEE|nr:carotenoid ester lipase precursor [Lentinus tigrinus ALCF2SS1-7]